MVRHRCLTSTTCAFHLGFGLGVVHPTYVNRCDIGDMEYLLRHGDCIQLAYSTVTHVFTSGNLPEEQPGHLPELAASAQPASMFNHGTMNTQEPKGSENHQEPLEQHEEPEIYEGTVQLTVEVENPIWLVINFVTELRLNSRFRMLRMEVNSPENVDIWLALREPLPLKQILDRMEEVAQVSGHPGPSAAQAGQVDILNVRLNAEFGRNSLNNRMEKSNSP